jgi:hypothetical protein
MFCDGSHLGFPISIKNRNLVKDIPNDHWKVLYKVSVFYADRKSKIAATAGHRLTLDPMGKCSNAFFSETTNMKTLCRGPSNDHSWAVWFQLSQVVSEKKRFETFFP